MATQAHIDNFGVQHGVASVLSGYYEIGTYAVPVGYVASGANVTDNDDGTFTLITAATDVTFTPGTSVSTEVTDSAGTTIAANTQAQSAL